MLGVVGVMILCFSVFLRMLILMGLKVFVLVLLMFRFRFMFRFKVDVVSVLFVMLMKLWCDMLLILFCILDFFI